MAIPINIDQLIRGNVIESERIEFKANWHSEAIMHTICAFANDIHNHGGGYIVIGIEEENGRALLPPKGLKSSEIDHIQKKFIEVCKRLQPNFFPIVAPMVYKEKHIIAIWVFGGDARPYKAPISMTKGSPYAFYIRRNSSTVKTTIDDEHELMRIAHRIPFDDRVNPHASISDFNPTLIKQYLYETHSLLYDEFDTMEFPKLCRLMQIARGPDEFLKPVNAGLLMFTNEPEKYFPYARIEVVTYHDDIGDQFRENYFKGPIHYQLRAALQHIRNEVLTEQVQKIDNQAEARRFFNYPFTAIEEALANAVYHKDYNQRSPIEVNIRLNQIDILSRPGPLPPTTMQDLNSGGLVIPREYRNRRIGDYLKELNLTEGRSTGLPKIIRAIKNNGSPLPTYQTDENRLYFLTIFPIHPDFDRPKLVVTYKDKFTPKNQTQSTKNQSFEKDLLVTQNVDSLLVTYKDKFTPKNQTQSANNQQIAKQLLVTQTKDTEKSRSRSEFYVHKKKVLVLCKKEPHTTKMLAEKLKRHPRVVYRGIIKPLLEQGLIQPVHSNPNAPNQAYTLKKK